MTEARVISSTKDILKAVAEKKGLKYEDVEKVYNAFVIGLTRDATLGDVYSFQLFNLGSLDINRKLVKDLVKFEGKKSPNREGYLDRLNHIQYHVDTTKVLENKHRMYTLENKLEKLLIEEGHEDILEISRKPILSKRNKIIKKVESLQNGE